MNYNNSGLPGFQYPCENWLLLTVVPDTIDGSGLIYDYTMVMVYILGTSFHHVYHHLQVVYAHTSNFNHYLVRNIVFMNVYHSSKLIILTLGVIQFDYKMFLQILLRIQLNQRVSGNLYLIYEFFYRNLLISMHKIVYKIKYDVSTKNMEGFADLCLFTSWET